MSAEGALVARLKAQSVAGGRIYPHERAPQGPTLPYVTFQMAGGERTHHAQGYANRRFTRIQVNVFASTASDRTATMDAVLTALDGQSYAGDSTSIEATVADTEPIDAPAEVGADDVLHRHVDFLLMYQE